MKSKLSGRNKIRAMNTWAVTLMRYGASVVNWTTSELHDQEGDDAEQRTIPRK